MTDTTPTPVPFFRPTLEEPDFAAVNNCMRAGWLTTGAITRDFEQQFAAYVGAPHAVALNSCTAALHLALEAIGLQRGEHVLVPVLTFAATAEVVRYFDATPVFVDCEPRSLCIDPAAAAATLDTLRAAGKTVRAIIPVHYGGQMADMAAITALADAHGISVIADAAHAVPAAIRTGPDAPWQNVGSASAAGRVACFSFYSNKCITCGEGGMAVTHDAALADRMRLMSLHGMSKVAWTRFGAGGNWDYEIVAPGYKYNLTDIASSLGLAQLSRADAFRDARRRVVAGYAGRLAHLPLELPQELPDRQHAWHLFVVRLREDSGLDRNAVVNRLRELQIGVSVHYRPLHLQPYYRESAGTHEGMFPVVEGIWPRMFSLPIFPTMTDAEMDRVAEALTIACAG
ncbi:MAG: DegT/DnrJ/EryC1/StrS family aminotransferase [Planctomycetota bacterium]